MGRHMKVLSIGLVLIAIIAACGGGSEADLVVAPTSVPLPSPTSAPIATSTASPTTPSPTTVVAAPPSPTSTFVARSSPTATPAPSAATAEPISQTVVSVPLSTFTSVEFDFSFEYPSSWILESDLQAITVKQPDGASAVVIGIDILQSAQGIRSYTQLSLVLFEQEFPGFESTSTTGTIVGELPGQVTYAEAVDAGGTQTEFKIFTAIIGSMGFTLSIAGQDTAFRDAEPLFDAIADSAKFPSGSFQPPATVISREVMSTGIDKSSSEPTGVATVFEETTRTFNAFLDMDFLPIGTELQFVWIQTDKNGNPIGVLDPVTAETGDDGALWSTFETPEAMALGFYLVTVFSEEDLVAVMPFSVVIEDGAEFTEAQSYVDWGTFLLSIDDPEKAVYAATKALELDSTITEAYVNRAEAHITSCQIDSATADLSKALGLEPDNSVILSRRANAHWYARDAAAALVDFNNAIRLDRNNAGYYNNRSLVQVALGRFDSAIADADQALALQPGILGLLDTRGYAYFKSGLFRNAKQDYDSLIDAGFEIPHVVLGLGLTNAALGDNQVARKLLEQGLALIEEEASSCLDPQISDLVQMAQTTLQTL